MPVIALCNDGQPEQAIDASMLAALAPGAPLVVMIHGFRYSPSRASRDPHRHILGLTPDPRKWGNVSWPRRLGLNSHKGMGLALGWEAGGTIWSAHRNASRSGATLARVIADLRRIAPQRPVHVIAHSLGAKVACAAIERLAPGDIDRVILLAAALSVDEARRAATSPAGRRATFVNVSGAENGIFDIGLRLALPIHGPRLGPGALTDEGWIDLRLDNPDVLDHLAQRGWRIAPPGKAVCHWSGYLRPGVWKLYRDLLVTPDPAALTHLRHAAAQALRPAPAAPPRKSFLLSPRMT
jgi:pimeloyl-ACP methyl ester carboxylesterase